MASDRPMASLRPSHLRCASHTDPIIARADAYNEDGTPNLSSPVFKTMQAGAST